jgi:hypothetical protein
VRRSLRLNAVTVHATTLCKILLQTRSPAPSESALPLWRGRCGSLDESRTVHGYRPTWLTRGPAWGTRHCPEGLSSRKPVAMPFTSTSSLLGWARAMVRERSNLAAPQGGNRRSCARPRARSDRRVDGDHLSGSGVEDRHGTAPSFRRGNAGDRTGGERSRAARTRLCSPARDAERERAGPDLFGGVARWRASLSLMRSFAARHRPRGSTQNFACPWNPQPAGALTMLTGSFCPHGPDP